MTTHGNGKILMKHITKISLAIALLLGAYQFSHAQSATDRAKIKAYYFAAEDALSSNNYDDAISALDKAKSLRGSTDARALAIRVKSLMGKGEFEAAQQSLNRLYELNPSEKTQREMAPILLELDKKVENQKRREQEQREEEARQAKERAAALQRLAEEELEAKRQAEVERVKSEKQAANNALQFAALETARQAWSKNQIEATKAARVSSIKRGSTVNIPPATKVDFKGDITLKSSGRLPNGDIVLVGERKRSKGGTRAWTAVFDSNGRTSNVERFKSSEFSTFQDVHVDKKGTILAVGAASDTERSREKMNTLRVIWPAGKKSYSYTIGDSGFLTAVSPGKDGHYVAKTDIVGGRIVTCKLPILETDKKMDDNCLGLNTDGNYEGFTFNDMIFDDSRQSRYAVGSRKPNLSSKGPEALIANEKSFFLHNMEGNDNLVVFEHVKVLADTNNLMTIGHVEFGADIKFDTQIKLDGPLQGVDLTVRNFDENGERVSRYLDVVQPRFTYEDISGVSRDIPNITKVKSSRIFGSPDDDYARAAVKTADGGLIIAADRVDSSGVQRGWIVRLDSNHERIWDIHLPSYAGAKRRDEVVGLFANRDGSYTVVGSSGFDGKKTDIWLQTFTEPR